MRWNPFINQPFSSPARVATYPLLFLHPSVKYSPPTGQS